MNRTDVLRRISSLIRQDHSAAMWALGYISLDLSTDVLEDLLKGLEEFSGPSPSTRALDAYKERWGRLPGARS